MLLQVGEQSAGGLQPKPQLEIKYLSPIVIAEKQAVSPSVLAPRRQVRTKNGCFASRLRAPTSATVAPPKRSA